MRYDFIIVGGGSAGCVLANRISEDGSKSVLLLEAGPDYTNLEELPIDLKDGYNVWRSAYGPHNWGYTATATPEQDEPIQIPRGRAIGGSSSINGQVLFRGVPEDYDNWAAWGNDEWEFTKVLPYFRKLESDLDFPGDDFHGSQGPIPVRRFKKDELLPTAAAFYDACVAEGFPEDPDQNSPDSIGIGCRPLNNIDGVRMSTALTYLNPARYRLNLTCKGSVTVHRILFDGTTAIGVIAESGGETFTVYGSEIIISSGAIASPQILLLSGIGPQGELHDLGIEVVKDVPGVGKNLRDHPAVFTLFKAHGDGPGDSAPSIQVGLRYSPEFSETRADIQVSPILMTSEHRPASVRIDSEEFHFGISAALQNAETSGTLTLRSTNPYEQPNLNYDYLSSDSDRTRMREAVRLGLRLAEQPMFSKLISERLNPTDEDLSSDERLDKWLLANAYTQHHSSGTCKMGPDKDPMAVVDQYCRVKGILGLRVVDASVMPDVIRANTNATTIMIAEKVADWINNY
ncbi:MAG: mycofactocin system GMC family oxidoreductase MftG [Chloroflexota bacterium]|nr:mycofactocin system GMC family oxidoreductase MftG [Chloroflexota bacterium]